MVNLPKLVIIRHGSTEWSEIGRHTGRTDLPITAAGIQKINAVSKTLFNPNGIIQSSDVCQIFVSPKQRAIQTLRLLNLPAHIPVEHCENLCEWNYGDYEGLTSAEIEQNKSEFWNIWTDGCPDGESPEEIERRVDKHVQQIKQIHQEAVGTGSSGDIICVAHAHILRALAARWINEPLRLGRHLLFDAGGLAVLSYAHGSLQEPVIVRWNLACF